MKELTTVKCEMCGTDTINGGTKRCDRCWEFEKQIDHLFFMKGNQRALSLINKVLEKYNLEIKEK